MSYVLLIGFRHGSDVPQVIAGPEVPYEEQRVFFKQQIAPRRSHPRFGRVEWLDSRRGVRKRKKFITPAEAEQRGIVEEFDDDDDEDVLDISGKDGDPPEEKDLLGEESSSEKEAPPEKEASPEKEAPPEEKTPVEKKSKNSPPLSASDI